MCRLCILYSIVSRLVVIDKYNLNYNNYVTSKLTLEYLEVIGTYT